MLNIEIIAYTTCQACSQPIGCVTYFPNTFKLPTWWQHVTPTPQPLAKCQHPMI